MSNNSVIGPIDLSTWITLKELRRSIKVFKDKVEKGNKEEKEKYSLGYKRHLWDYQYIMDTDVLKRAA